MRRSLIRFLAILVVLTLLAIRFSEHIAYLKWRIDNYAYRIQFERNIRKELGIIPFCKRIKGSYLAPTNACDDEITRVPDEYTVFLRRGYTLEEHQRNVGAVDWDVALGPVYADPETRAPYYKVLTDETGLAALRADVGVDLVECRIMTGPVDIVWTVNDEGATEDVELD